MGKLLRLAWCVGFALLSSGCFFYGVRLHVRPLDPERAFTAEEQETAKRIAIEICSAAGFRETDVAAKLSDHPSSSPYIGFVSLGAPGGGDFDQDSVSILGVIRKDRREIIISLGDTLRDEPLPSTQKMIDDLRAALERAFPDARVEMEMEKTLRAFGP